jgi:hypothetical protein
MTDEQVRALLASQPHSETLPHPAATVAILRRHVEDATDDLGAVERWIAGQSGQRHIGAPTKSLTHRIGSARPHYDGPFPYYIIPAEALVEPVLSPPNLVRLDERIGAIAHGHGSYASGAKPA